MPQLPQGIRKIKGIYLILLLSLILNAIGIRYGLPSYQGWHPDEVLPRDVKEGIGRQFSHDWFRKYPPFHYYLLALAQAPFLAFGELGGVDFKDLSFYSSLILVGRFLSLFMGVGLVVFVYKCGREMFDQKSSLWAASITALIVPFVYHAKTTNLDIPYLFWFMISVYFFLRLFKTHQRKYYLLFALTAVVAVCTKDQAYGLYILPPLFVLAHDWRFQKKAVPNLKVLPFLGSRTYIYAVLVALGTFFLVYNLAFNWQGFVHHVQVITGPTSQNYRLYPSTLSGHLHLLGRTFEQVRFSMGWPLFLVCLAGLFRALVSRPRNILGLSLLTFAVPYDIFYIHVIGFSYARYYLPICIILSFFGGEFLTFALGAFPKLSRVVQAAVALIFLYSVLYAFSLDVYMVKDSRYSAENWVKQNIPKEATIGVVDWITYAQRLEGYRWFFMMPSLEHFRKLSPKPDFIIIDAEFFRGYPPQSRELQFFGNFYRDRERYKPIFQAQTSLPWLPLRDSAIRYHINQINPKILIYEKIEKEPIGPRSNMQTKAISKE
jgi:4-amino-4-deoxy-L-arabinose transferase-like glycosyltransferase